MSGGHMVIGDSNGRQSLSAIGFRVAATAQLIAVLAQALLAGLALSGNASALAAHVSNGGLALLICLLQLVFALLLSRSNQRLRWLVVASAALFLGEGMQMASGRLHLFVLHLPLGVVLFGGLGPFVVWAWTRRPAPISESRTEQVAPGSLLGRVRVGGDS
jgi:asparagine N-glycosylation enzyme membrane subunit Stt3